VRLEDGARHVVAQGGSYPVWSPSGHLLYARQGRIYAARLDPATATRQAAPATLVEGVGYSPRNGGAQFGVADDGTLVYRPGAVTSLERRLVWIDASGEITPLPIQPRRFSDPRASPDGRRVAVRIGPGDAADLWVVDARSGTLTRLTFDEPVYRPGWGPGEDSITWASHAQGRWRIATVDAAGSTPARTLIESDNRIYPNAWSRDGRKLIYQERHPERGWDLRLQEFDESGQPLAPSRALVARPANEERARLSLDERWLAYESDELDAVVDVYVRLVAGGAATRVTSDGGRSPLWGRDGRLFAWRTGRDRFLQVQLPLGALPAQPRPVWPGAPLDEMGPVERRILAMGTEGGDIDAPRDRFLMMAPTGAEEAPIQDTGLAVVLGWPEALRP
jgi:serine/threonine-protein kinase